MTFSQKKKLFSLYIYISLLWSHALEQNIYYVPSLIFSQLCPIGIRTWESHPTISAYVLDEKVQRNALKKFANYKKIQTKNEKSDKLFVFLILKYGKF